MHMSPASLRGRPPGQPVGLENELSKVEDFLRGWGNLIRQSPLDQVLLNEKSPISTSYNWDSLDGGGVLWYLGMKFYLFVLSLEKKDNICIEQIHYKEGTSGHRFTEVRTDWFTEVRRDWQFFHRLLKMTWNNLPLDAQKLQLFIVFPLRINFISAISLSFLVGRNRNAVQSTPDNSNFQGI